MGFRLSDIHYRVLRAWNWNPFSPCPAMPNNPCHSHACTSTPASGCGFFLGNYNFSVVVCWRMGEFFTNYLLCIQLSVYTHCIIRIMNWIGWLCGVRREDLTASPVLLCVCWGCSHWVIYNHRFLILFFEFLRMRDLSLLRCSVQSKESPTFSVLLEAVINCHAEWIVKETVSSSTSTSF